MKNGAFIILAIIMEIQMGLASVNRPALADSSLRVLLKKHEVIKTLNFPRATFLFYQNNNFRFIWLSSEYREVLSEATRLLRCVTPYGLNAKNYHPEVLREMVVFDEETSAENEILFSDALITLIAHLHFGTANPAAPPAMIDNEEYKLFRPEKILQNAVNGRFRETILEVQPQDPGYQALQTYLSQATGRFAAECKELSTDTLKLLALNLERYRWMNDGYERFNVTINIPAFMLRVQHNEDLSDFKVVVGKPGNPTPQLSSTIKFLNTAPDWNVPARIFRNELLPKMIRDPSFASRNNFSIYDHQGRYIPVSRQTLRLVQAKPYNYSMRQSSGCDNALGQIVFRFTNNYNVYLHDTPEKSYFLRPYRALSHGCIRVENPRKLLSLLLIGTGASKEAYTRITKYMESNTKYTYTFLRPIPITIMYITCAVKEGRLIQYDDIYDRDKALSSVLFND